MGNNASASQERVSLDGEEIRRLEKRFRKLDTNGSGTLTPEGLYTRGCLPFRMSIVVYYFLAPFKRLLTRKKPRIGFAGLNSLSIEPLLSHFSHCS